MVLATGGNSMEIPLMPNPLPDLGLPFFPNAAAAPPFLLLVQLTPPGLALIFSSFSPNLSQLLSYFSHPVLVLFKITKVQG